MADVPICTVCCRVLDQPYRSLGPGGVIVQGCISPEHDPYLVPGTADHAWANRPEAQDIRKRLDAYKFGGITASAQAITGHLEPGLTP